MLAAVACSKAGAVERRVEVSVIEWCVWQTFDLPLLQLLWEVPGVLIGHMFLGYVSVREKVCDSDKSVVHYCTCVLHLLLLVF